MSLPTATDTAQVAATQRSMNPAITALWVTAAFGGVAALAVLSPSGMQGFAQAVSDGLRLGLIIALIGMGLSLVFATSGVFNFAHGEFATLGALSAWWLNAIVGVPLILAIAIAVVIGAIVGVGSERGLWRPLRHRGVSLTSTLVVAIGLGLASRNLFLFIFGGGSVSYSEYTVQQTISVLGVDMLPKQIVSEMICIAALVGVGIFLKVSSTGQSIRAVADDQVLAGASGIEVNRTLTIVWALGGAMAALGGALLGLFQQIDWAMGNELLLLIIAGVTLGGLDTVKGAVIGSVLVGIVTQVSVLFLPAELKYMTALAILILILLLRPQGIFGRRRRVG